MREALFMAKKMVLVFVIVWLLEWEFTHGSPLMVILAVGWTCLVIAIRKPFRVRKETLVYATKIALALVIFGCLAWETLHGSLLAMLIFACMVGAIIAINNRRFHKE